MKRQSDTINTKTNESVLFNKNKRYFKSFIRFLVNKIKGTNEGYKQLKEQPQRDLFQEIEDLYTKYSIFIKVYPFKEEDFSSQIRYKAVAISSGNYKVEVKEETTFEKIYDAYNTTLSEIKKQLMS